MIVSRVSLCAPWFCWKLSRSKRPGTTLMLGRLSNPTNLPPLHPEMQIDSFEAAEIALNSNFWSLTGLLYASYWNILKQNNLLHQQLNGYHSKKGVTPMFSLGPSLQKPSTTSPSCKKVKIPSDTRACVKSYGSLGPKERCCSRVSVAWLSEKPTAGFPECCRWLTYESTLQS